MMQYYSSGGVVDLSAGCPLGQSAWEQDVEEQEHVCCLVHKGLVLNLSSGIYKTNKILLQCTTHLGTLPFTHIKTTSLIFFCLFSCQSFKIVNFTQLWTNCWCWLIESIAIYANANTGVLENHWRIVQCRDSVKVLWCHSYLVWLVFEGSITTYALVFIQKTFEDLLEWESGAECVNYCLHLTVDPI